MSAANNKVINTRLKLRLEAAEPLLRAKPNHTLFLTDDIPAQPYQVKEPEHSWRDILSACFLFSAAGCWLRRKKERSSEV